jgi:hypothetical protein
LHILDFIAFESEITSDHIEDYVSHGVPDMAFIIGGNTTDIHGHHFAAGMKNFPLSG